MSDHERLSGHPEEQDHRLQRRQRSSDQDPRLKPQQERGHPRHGLQEDCRFEHHQGLYNRPVIFS